MTRAEPSRAEPRRRNRGGERHDGGATTGSIIEKNGFSNASQLEEEMEKEEAYGDDLLRQLRRRTSFRWIGEEPWRDTLLPSRDVARFLDENSFLPRKRGSGGSGGRERAKTGNSFIYTRCVLF